MDIVDGIPDPHVAERGIKKKEKGEEMIRQGKRTSKLQRWRESPRTVTVKAYLSSASLHAASLADSSAFTSHCEYLSRLKAEKLKIKQVGSNELTVVEGEQKMHHADSAAYLRVQHVRAGSR